MKKTVGRAIHPLLFAFTPGPSRNAADHAVAARLHCSANHAKDQEKRSGCLAFRYVRTESNEIGPRLHCFKRQKETENFLFVLYIFVYGDYIFFFFFPYFFCCCFVFGFFLVDVPDRAHGELWGVGCERSGQTSQRCGQDGTTASRGDSGGLHERNRPPSQRLQVRIFFSFKKKKLKNLIHRFSLRAGGLFAFVAFYLYYPIINFSSPSHPSHRSVREPSLMTAAVSTAPAYQDA